MRCCFLCFQKKKGTLETNSQPMDKHSKKHYLCARTYACVCVCVNKWICRRRLYIVTNHRIVVGHEI